MSSNHEHSNTLYDTLRRLISIPFLSLTICGVSLSNSIHDYKQRTTLAWSAQSFKNQDFFIYSTFQKSNKARSSHSWYEIDLKDQNHNIILHQKLNPTFSNISRLSTGKDYLLENVSLFIAKDKNGTIIEQRFNSAVATMENGEKVEIVSGNMLPNHNIIVKKTKNIIYINTAILSIANLFLLISLINLYKERRRRLATFTLAIWIIFNIISIPLILSAFSLFV